MTTTSLKIKGQRIASTLLVASIIMLYSCQKPEVHIHSNQAANYSSEVLDKWMTMQLRLMRNATGIPNQAFSRHYVYAGITALESIAPGLKNNSWSAKWNGLNGLPVTARSVHYYYPANINAAMAAINKALFATASNTDKGAIDSLENALTQEFLTSQPPSVVDVSKQFGRAVAAAVFSWAETDGYKNASDAYTAPVGIGLWTPTPPAMGNAVSPYWGNNRTAMIGSLYNTQPGAPVSYSTEASSYFYRMAKEVYDASQNLTDDQKAMAMFWRDVPGVTSPGHWLSIVQQAVRQTNTSLDKAALAYALTGAAINDGLISCWQTKYKYNVVRPITYIRDVFGYSSWSSFLTTPAHPEYSSAHAVLSVAAAEVMQQMFGNIGSITDHTYDYLNFAPRTYRSFSAIGEEAGLSRFYAGIHYKASIEAGTNQGKQIAANIFELKYK